MSIKIILKNIQASGNTELFSKYIVIEQLQSGVHKEKFNYDSEFTNLEENFDIAHNYLIEILVASGIFALIFYLIFLVLFLFHI